ncbi:uncharacterized protein MKZ38_010284 [Zalerion maritima]|uniref:phosphoinositide 5-phosphatase n=1 Tax=Zalerion maritima TaxID=339359 RepID=A0AAD5RU27_9PEZI|nr:uncharacterized protein MKZ38_010284 [Zalerion maritima]
MDPYFPPPPRAATATGATTQKSSQLLISEYPHRAIAIATSSHALILRHNATSSDRSLHVSAKCMVEFLPVSKQDLVDFHPLTPRPIYGTLGLVSVGRDVFLCVVTQAIRVANVRPEETVERIGNVEFFCLNSSQYDDVYAMNPYGIDPSEYPRRDPTIDHPCQDLQKLLRDGSFYYSTDFDLTNRLQDRSSDAGEFDIENFDEAFLWNSFMIKPLLDFRSKLLGHEREILDASRILTSAIRGYCQSLSIPQNSAPIHADTGLPSMLTVISRLSCMRAGTRFNARGIDDDGNVANFVETETIYWSPSGILFSYAQVRGSVPVFWEQAAGLKPGQQKISITRNRDGTQPAFDRHFEELEQNYGAVHILNLLSQTKSSENDLINLYAYCVEHCRLRHPGEKQSEDHALLRATYYDFHAETKGPEGYLAAQAIEAYIAESAEGFAYYLAQPVDDDAQSNGQAPGHERLTVVLQQEGVFRTNCLDCLDRTNLIQSIVSQLAVRSFLQQIKTRAGEPFWAHHSTLWADNGDALSKIYAGTGALKSSFTRHGKMSLAGAIADVRKSAERLYINNFADKGRQQTIDTLLGRVVGQVQASLHDPISDYVAQELRQRKSEFSASQKINMLVGTFNLNGKTEGIVEDLSPWLCPPELGNSQPDIVTIGFQEIVELSPQQIMNSDPRRKQLWEEAVKKTLNLHAQQTGGDKYVLLRSGQLVGAALCIFVKASVLSTIKNVEGSVKKTGLSGMAGNKGAVAIRMDYANTQLCFVTAHLAAGFTNYEERNRDYITIHDGLHFQRNRRIANHDTVIWLGDFNYRIGLGNEVARDLVKRSDVETLYSNDQLNLQMVAGNAFQHYSEARILFPPTYKFDIGTDTYDTSEKTRIPAWTDRILRKGTNLKQLSYNCAPLKFSDHRPVYATFDCIVNIIDTERREKISRNVYERRKAEVNGHTSTVNNSGETDDEDLIGYESIEPDLPKASSDQQKWWLENGQMARSQVLPPKPRMITNPRRPTNPFPRTDEPDWVSVSRPTSYCSVASSQFEHIPSPNSTNMLSHSSGTNGPRKFPPPYDPAALPARARRLNLIDDQPLATKGQTQKQEPPPPPPPRRQGTSGIAKSAPLNTILQPQQTPAQTSNTHPRPPRPASSASFSSTVSKKPPPVAKKPAHLKPNSPTNSPPQQTTKEFPPPLVEKRPSLPPRTSTNAAVATSVSSGLAPRFDPLQKPIGPSPSPRTTNGTSNIALAKQHNVIGDWGPDMPPRRVRTPGPEGQMRPGAVGLPGMIKQDQRQQQVERKPVAGSGLSGGVAPPKVPTATKPTMVSIPPKAPKKPTVLQQSQQGQQGGKQQSNVDLLGSLDADPVPQIKEWEAMRPS